MNFKIIKKNYDDELEAVLSKKAYAEDVKNLLLDILYKIENAYDDYETVKINTPTRDEYEQRIIDVIENNCDSIIFAKDKSKEDNFYINKDQKEIKCYPIERKVLYALGKIQKNDDILKSNEKILNKAFTDMLNIGNNINMVEPLRDFNGFSWNVSINEIENIYCNLIYQDLIFLVGYQFLDEWTNNSDISEDYFKMFLGNLEKKYGKKSAKNIICSLKKLSILIEINIKPNIKDEIIEKSQNVKQQIKDMSNIQEFLEKILKEKLKIQNEIKKYDLLINDKILLQEEYNKRNEQLSLNKKIFSTRALAEILKQERKELLNKLRNYNKIINPRNFRKYYDNLVEEDEYLQDSQDENVEIKILENIIILQKEVLNIFGKKIRKCNNENDLIKIIYEYRYLYLIPLPVDYKKVISKKIFKLENAVINEIVDKTNELKITNNIFKESEKEIEIIKKIFSLKIISLKDIYFKISESEGKFYIQFFDEDIMDERFIINLELKKDDFKVKLDKKIKLFI